jgi:hypothetical protein
MACNSRDLTFLRVFAMLKGDRRGAATVLGVKDVTVRVACLRYRKDGLLNHRDEPTAAGLAALYYDDKRGPN